jgi:signal transduction histidine kinase
MSFPILTVEIRYEHDVVLARQRARQIAEILGFERQDQVRLATGVSESARNAFQYAKGGKVEFIFTDDTPQCFVARISDKGPGIHNLHSILNGEYRSQTGMGLGILGAKRLMDQFDIQSDPRGTTILLGKCLPLSAPRLTGAHLGQISQRLAQQSGENAFVEMRQQNQELLATMTELQRRQEELSQLNRELEDTNRGVVALYAELDERADFLRRVSESKSRFLSNMTHEFRSPLNSIMSLSRMLLDKLDGPLTIEQEKQVGFIRRAATDLSNLVDDLLDLAKVEAGKVSIRPESFELEGLFNSLRGTLRPLLAQNSSVNLVFDDPVEIPLLHTDEAKLSQILRNFISNALKYTEKGEVRVSAQMDDSEHVRISVADTGIGIAPENHARIFEEFEQVEGPQQRKIKGTGLGLPLAKSLAELLGGSVHLESQLGLGSTFCVRLPRRYPDLAEAKRIPAADPSLPLKRVLIVDDDEASRYVLKSLLSGNQFQIAEVEGGEEGVRQAIAWKPSLIFLDLGLPDLDGHAVLRKLKQNRETLDIPVIINTSRPLEAAEQAELATMAVGVIFKNHKDQAAVREAMRELLMASGINK